jgi:predicted transcriptional regulator of viral defense system
MGFLSALIAHRLTDLHSTTAYAAIRQESRYRHPELELPGGTQLRVVRLNPSGWPAADSGELERFRVIENSKEFAWRSSLERTLVDALTRPELCAGFETVTLAWARAHRAERADWERVAMIAERLGSSASRRTGFMFDLLAVEGEARQRLTGLPGRTATTPLDRSNSFGLERGSMTRDPRTGVLINVPESYLRGWVASAELP